MNVLFTTIPANIHILIVNNGIGVEFKNYSHRCAVFGKDADSFVAAGGHNGCKSPELIRNIAKCLSINYLSASTKDEFLSVVNQWIKPGERASLFEVFVEEEDDVSALRTLNMLGINKKKRVLNKVRRMFRK